MTIDSFEEANKIVFEDNVLRVQPPAPKPTEYYYIEEGWTRKIAGQEITENVSVEKVRREVMKAMKNNDKSGGGGVRAVEKSEMVE